MRELGAMLFGMFIGGAIGILLTLWAFLRMDDWQSGILGKKFMEEVGRGKETKRTGVADR